MAKVVTCPSCQSKGSIPDDAKAGRIRCPKCGEMFDVKASVGRTVFADDEEAGVLRRPATRSRAPLGRV